MSINNVSKLNHLLQNVPPGTIMLSSWLKSKGYSHSLQHKYVKSKWLEPVGTGAFKRMNDKVEVLGALYTLQTQKNQKIHIGGISALSLQGYAHYIRMQDDAFTFFSNYGFRWPSWFENFNNNHQVLYCTNFLSPDLGLEDFQVKNFQIKISSPSRAMLECLELVPKNFDISEAYLLMEGLNNLRPSEVQLLLENCSSIKVKRLFLYLAEKASHTWVKHLNLSKINLGAGKRVIVKGGVLNSKYNITIPKQFN